MTAELYREGLEAFICENYPDGDRCEITERVNPHLYSPFCGPHPRYGYPRHFEIYPECHPGCFYEWIATVYYTATHAAAFGVTTCGRYHLWMD
jgi:hypothetical protein